MTGKFLTESLVILMNKKFIKYGAVAVVLTYASVFMSINYNSRLNKNLNKVSASTVHFDTTMNSEPISIAEGPFFTPSVSLDGTRLLYSSGDNIYEMDLNTKSVHQLTTIGNCFNPAYSVKDMNLIAFARNDGIYTLDKSKNITKKVVSSENKEVAFAKPSFTPDGNIIYFKVKVLPKPDGHGFVEKDAYINMVSMDGKKIEKLVEGYNPACSKDGRKLIYEVKDKIYILDLQTKQSTFVGEGKYASWSNSGKWVSYTLSSKVTEPYSKYNSGRNLFIDKEFSNIRIVGLFNLETDRKITTEEFEDRSKEIEEWANDVKHTNIDQHFLLTSSKAYFDSTWSKDDKELYVCLYNSSKGGFELVKYNVDKN